MSGEATNNGHLSAETVAAYLDETLSGTQRSSVEDHLADCEQCRGEVVEVARILHRRPGRRGWLLIAPAAAAAAVLAFVLIGMPNGGPTDGPATRGPSDTDAALRGIEVVQPSPDEVVAPANLTFTWRRAETDASYRLTVTDAGGEVAWSVTTTDTSIVLPTGTRLVPDNTYYWYVDALLLDGRSITSGVRELTVRP